MIPRLTEATGSFPRRRHAPAGTIPALAALAFISITPAGPPTTGTTGPGGDIGIRAVEYGVADVDRAARFYREALGFSIESSGGGAVTLTNAEARLRLTATDAPAAPPGGARIYMNMSVGSLDSARRAVLSAGGAIHGETPRMSAVGPYIEARDPHGHPVHLIDHPDDEMNPGSPPRLFNIGVHVRDMAEAESFLTRLGFEVATRDYLPTTLVFRRSGMAYLVLHEAAGGLADDRVSSGALILETGDPRRVALRAGVSAPAAGEIPLRDPSGNLIRVVGYPAPTMGGERAE